MLPKVLAFLPGPWVRGNLISLKERAFCFMNSIHYGMAHKIWASVEQNICYEKRLIWSEALIEEF